VKVEHLTCKCLRGRHDPVDREEVLVVELENLVVSAMDCDNPLSSYFFWFVRLPIVLNAIRCCLSKTGESLRHSPWPFQDFFPAEYRPRSE